MERADALETWHTYARPSLLKYSSELQGQRVALRYQSRGTNISLEGPKEAASILTVGLEDLGAEVVSSDGPFDWQIEVRRYSQRDAMYQILNADGTEVDRGVIHHQMLVSTVIQRLAEHCLHRREAI